MSKRFFIKPQGPLSKEKAWLLGLCAGDACIVKTQGNIYCGLDEGLAQRASQVLEETFGLPAPVRLLVRRDRQGLWVAHFKAAVAQHLMTLAPWGITRWRVPDCVKVASPEIKAAWLAGFFDAECHVMCRQRPGHVVRRVRVDTVNEQGMDDVSALLGEFGIEHKRYRYIRKGKKGKRCRPAFIISVQRNTTVLKFLDLVKLAGPMKQATVKKIHDLESGILRTACGKQSRWLSLAPQIRELRAQGKKHKEIGALLGFSSFESANILAWANRKEGIPRKRRRDLLELLPAIQAKQKEGFSISQTASALGLSVFTVKNVLCRFRKVQKQKETNHGQ